VHGAILYLAAGKEGWAIDRANERPFGLDYDAPERAIIFPFTWWDFYSSDRRTGVSGCR
jgi:hypothetical protein